MAATRADRLRHDQLILHAAAHLLAVDPAATLQQIADAAGVSRLTLYRGFADRAALIAALRRTVDAELDRVLEQLPAWDVGVDALGHLVRGLAGVAARYPIATLRYSPVPGPPPRADARISAVLREGQRVGALRDDVGPEVLNAMLFGTLSALVPGRDPHPDTDPPAGRRDPGPPDPTAAETVLTLLRTGMTSPEGTNR